MWCPLLDLSTLQTGDVNKGDDIHLCASVSAYSMLMKLSKLGALTSLWRCNLFTNLVSYPDQQAGIKGITQLLQLKYVAHIEALIW